jgi:hypothetical protein
MIVDTFIQEEVTEILFEVRDVHPLPDTLAWLVLRKPANESSFLIAVHSDTNGLHVARLLQAFAKVKRRLPIPYV